MATASNTAVTGAVQVTADTLAQAIVQAQRPLHKIKTPRFSEQRDLSEYLADFQKIADRNGWSDTEAGIELQSVLEGRALSLALSVPTTSLQEISRVLKERLTLRPEEARRNLSELRLEKEEVEELGNQVRRLADKGYGKEGFDLSADRLAQEKINAYLDALRPDELAHQVRLQRPATLEDAVQYAKEYFIFQARRRNTKHVRTLETTEQLATQIDQLRQELIQVRQTNSQEDVVKCRICGEHHYASGCPNKKRTPKPQTSGN
jgi:hypothetical protein